MLQLANVVAGRYIFKLDVFDAEGLTSSDTASVIIKPGKCRLLLYTSLTLILSYTDSQWRLQLYLITCVLTSSKETLFSILWINIV